MKKFSWGAVLGFIIAVVLLGLLLVGFVSNLLDCMRYARVYDEPVYVDAVVTSHDESTDSDDDTTYYSYVSYTYEGEKYTHIRYEAVHSPNERSDLGTQVRLKVNPEAPNEPIDRIANPFTTVLAGLFVALLLSVAVRQLLRGRLSKKATLPVDEHTVRRDARIAIFSRFFLLAWPFVAVLLLALHQVFPMLFGEGYLYAALAALTCWVICLVFAVKASEKLRHGAFSVRSDMVIKKEIEYDSDGNTYKLYFSGPNGQWCKNVKSTEYHQAYEGMRIFSVYLEQKKKPLLYYDSDGKATI